MNKTLLNLWNGKIVFFNLISDLHYIKKQYLFSAGVPTGNCIKSSLNPEMRVCEIFAWCPVERDENKYYYALLSAMISIAKSAFFLKQAICYFLIFKERCSIRFKMC